MKRKLHYFAGRIIETDEDGEYCGIICPTEQEYIEALPGEIYKEEVGDDIPRLEIDLQLELDKIK